MRATVGILPVAALSLALLNGCSVFGGVDPNSPEAQAAVLNLKLGAGYMEQHRFDLALEKLNKALAYNENMPEAHNAIAVLYEETGKKEDAEHHYLRALELNSNYTLARKNYARFLCKNNHVAEGEAQFLAMVAATTSDSVAAYEAYVNAAACALAVPDRKRAEEHLRRALEAQPNGAEALFKLADLRYADGEYLQARGFLQRYHDQARFSPESLALGINIEDKLGDENLRRQYARLLLTQFANSEQARRLKSQ